MVARMGTAGLLALAGVLLCSTAGQANDVIRLVLPAQADTPTLNLVQIDNDAATFDVRGYRGGYYGGYRGGYHGGYRGYYGGYRAYHYGYRPSYRYNYSYSYPRAYGYYPGYSYYPGYYYYYPISTVSTPVPTTTFSLKIGPVGTPTQPQPLPYLPTPNGIPPSDGTFEYDGGPRSPVPLPKAEPAPMNTQPGVPLEGRPVSLRTPPKYTYPAYGELPRNPAPVERVIPVNVNRR